MQKSGTIRTIYSNFQAFDTLLKDSELYRHVFVGAGPGQWSPHAIHERAGEGDIVILNIDHERLLPLCTRRFFSCRKKYTLLSVDLLLRRPTTIKEKSIAFLKSILLRQVDLFILYFRNTSGYERYFGIDRGKIRYIPFKVNSWESGFADYSADPSRGDYVLCAGQTLRDLKTFVEAMRIAGVPGVLLTPGEEMMRRHGTRLITEGLPANLRLAVHADGREETFLQWIKNSAIVVVPRFRSDIASSGISTYLCAMASWRCVILTKGPGAEDVLRDGEAILVDPQDPRKLAEAILSVWHDRDVRAEVARKGRRYVERLQGEERLLRDILRLCDPHPLPAPHPTSSLGSGAARG